MVRIYLMNMMTQTIISLKLHLWMRIFIQKIIDLYEYVVGINMAISHEVIMNITKMNEISSQLKDFFKKYYTINASKEVSDKKLRNLKDWICQLLDTNYKYGFFSTLCYSKIIYN